jgi:hypothetical protein
MMTRRVVLVLAAALASLALGGCRTSGPTDLTIGPERFDEAFEATKDVLRAEGFELERVDARAGIITTRPLASSGFWTPWITTERRLRDEMESSVHRQRRRAEVRFVTDASDARLAKGPVRVDVDVRVERVYQPGVRATPASVRLRHVSDRPGEPSPRDEPVFAVDHSSDRALAAELARRLAAFLDLELDEPDRIRRGAPAF